MYLYPMIGIRKRRTTATIFKPAAEKRRRQQIIQEILNESSENIDIGNTQEPNIDAFPANTVENIEVDSAPLTLYSIESIAYEAISGFSNKTFFPTLNYKCIHKILSELC